MQYMPGTLVVFDIFDFHRTLHYFELYNHIGFELEHTDNFIYFDTYKDSISKNDKYNSKQI